MEDSRKAVWTKKQKKTKQKNKTIIRVNTGVGRISKLHFMGPVGRLG